jgi:hypothetical protein
VAETDAIYGEDPAFANAAGDDFAIAAASPAAGAGIASSVDGDLNGDCFAEPPSLGAY